mmetsp:Transcript_6273/g.27632  ORF Transcript_6273/g.27632 Transcript_6273/m.27632 type:complete len:277 (-) Transcript_6273:59-889(-)
MAAPFCHVRFVVEDGDPRVQRRRRVIFALRPVPVRESEEHAHADDEEEHEGYGPPPHPVLQLRVAHADPVFLLLVLLDRPRRADVVRPGRRRGLGADVVLGRRPDDWRLGGVLLMEPEDRLLAHLLVAPVVVLSRARLASIARRLPRRVVVRQPSLRSRPRRARVEHRGIGLDGLRGATPAVAPSSLIVASSAAGSRAWNPPSLRVHQRLLHLLGAAQVLAALGAPETHVPRLFVAATARYRLSFATGPRPDEGDDRARSLPVARLVRLDSSAALE